MTTVTFRRLHDNDQPLPAYATDGSAGMDLRTTGGGWLHPGQSSLWPTGLAVSIPSGFEGQIRPRSGLAARHGITVLNAPGTIDNDFTGELMVLLINHGEERFWIAEGDRIAQLVIAPVVQATIAVAESLDETVRGVGGFGSTGIR